MSAQVTDVPSVAAAKAPLQVVAIGMDSTSLATIRTALAETGAGLCAYSDRAALLNDGHLPPKLRGAEGVIFVVDFGGGESLTAHVASELQAISKSPNSLIALSSRAEPSVILEAMRAGCNEYLTKPLDGCQFSAAIAHARARWSATDGYPKNKSGRVLGFLGVRGGAGSTTLAVHLATFLAKCHGKRTVIVDQHPQLGHVALLLGLDAPAYHFLEAVLSIDRMDAALLNSLVTHHSSGVDVLASPVVLDKLTSVSLYSVERTLKFLAESYEYVLVDISSHHEDEILSVANCCDELYLVATQEIPALRDLTRYLDRLAACQVPPAKLKVVLNRYHADRALTVQQIESAIKRPVVVQISNSTAELMQSIDKGDPVPPDRRSDFCREMKRWANSLLPVETATPAHPKRGFRFWS